MTIANKLGKAVEIAKRNRQLAES